MKKTIALLWSMSTMCSAWDCVTVSNMFIQCVDAGRGRGGGREEEGEEEGDAEERQAHARGVLAAAHQGELQPRDEVLEEGLVAAAQDVHPPEHRQVEVVEDLDLQVRWKLVGDALHIDALVLGEGRLDMLAHAPLERGGHRVGAQERVHVLHHVAVARARRVDTRDHLRDVAEDGEI